MGIAILIATANACLIVAFHARLVRIEADPHNYRRWRDWFLVVVILTLSDYVTRG